MGRIQEELQMKKKREIDKNILESINSPNAWSPELEDKWLRQLGRLSNKEIYEQFPPCKKPPHISKVVT